MNDLTELVNKMQMNNLLTIEDIPNIDLYMDQVIQLFENKLVDSKRRESDKVMTKTMINNYSKAKLLFPIENKKYSKQHLILISLIYQLKGTLSLGDIKVTLDRINKQMEEEVFPLEELYDCFLRLAKDNEEAFRVDIKHRTNEVKDIMKDIESEDKSYVNEFLHIASLVNMSNMYRRLAEKMVDQMVEKE